MSDTADRLSNDPPDKALLPAVYFDGQTNKKHSVTLKPASCLEIAEDGTFLAGWAYGDIRRADGPKDVLRLRSIAAAPLARLEIRDAAAQAEITRLSTLLDGEGSPGDGSRRKIILWSIGATVSILAIIWFGIPLLADSLTSIVPVSLERRLGEASDRQIRTIFGDKTCTTPDGVQALQKLVGKLQGRSAASDRSAAGGAGFACAKCLRLAGRPGLCPWQAVAKSRDAGRACRRAGA